ncbi:type II secretion system F family protein [Halocella sp. SP3-1]|uniref:type II secretion system F family protein n=1 Tax=Halocella sp. SP3-1 TaxID=2382161 RepID=UPI000F751EC9|nr:type II secretion system F family protein [Halocella sp. SP3-1]AZO95692.1 type II secretion system F family protein [Halocella sp. SP3-1]
MSPLYEYEAVNHSGNKISGTIEVEAADLAAKQLKEKGYYPTAINEKKEKKKLADYLTVNKRVKTKDLTIFSQQFAAMIDAGISLVDCLNILYQETEHSRLKEVIRGMQEDIETGMSLSETMMKYPAVFPTLYCQLIKAGETGGVLDKILNQLVNHYERQDEINRKIKSALYYPFTILIVAILVVIFLLVRIVPMFVTMFAGFGAELPWPTRILLGLSAFVQAYWWFLLIIMVLLILILYKYLKTAEGKHRLDRFILKIPVLGKMIKKIIISRFASTLAVLLGSGIDLLASLAVVEEVLNNKVYADLLLEARGQIREGVNLSHLLAEAAEFPGMVVQMVRIGEESGSLEKMLQKINIFYEQEVESSIDASISLIEPMMIVLLALVVGFIVISIVMPMFDMYQYF